MERKPQKEVRVKKSLLRERNSTTMGGVRSESRKLLELRDSDISVEVRIQRNDGVNMILSKLKERRNREG